MWDGGRRACVCVLRPRSRPLTPDRDEAFHDVITYLLSLHARVDTSGLDDACIQDVVVLCTLLRTVPTQGCPFIIVCCDSHTFPCTCTV
jgi:hypothetical protein